MDKAHWSDSYSSSPNCESYWLVKAQNNLWKSYRFIRPSNHIGTVLAPLQWACPVHQMAGQSAPMFYPKPVEKFPSCGLPRTDSRGDSRMRCRHIQAIRQTSAMHSIRGPVGQWRQTECFLNLQREVGFSLLIGVIRKMNKLGQLKKFIPSKALNMKYGIRWYAVTMIFGRSLACRLKRCMLWT